MTTRSQDWPILLNDALMAASERPFSWGRHDCCLFAADIVRAMTGEDAAAPFRGRYGTKRGAMRALKAFAGGGLPEAVRAIAKHHGWEELSPVALAGRGDLAMLDTEDGPSLAICIGSRVAMAARDGGVAFLPLGSCYAAWRIP
ncbi:MAG: DUF6950 family protein [Alphaproteobacteria bacterium]